MVILMFIIDRPQDSKRINEMHKWTLVFGRRKTGKSFIIEKFVKHDEYFFVKSDGTIFSKNGVIIYDTFLEILKRSLADNKTIVIDEFHRLNKDFFDFLHYTSKQGKLILVSSTLYLSNKLISEKSPLLGLFAEIPISLISLDDCLHALEKHKLDNKHLLETAIIFREPVAIAYFNQNEPKNNLTAKILESSLLSIPALIGEIFVEEERQTSAIYEGIMRAIANGSVISSEISSYLFSRKLIQKDDPSIIQQYLQNLIKFGIIKKIDIYGKKRFIYKHVSPLAKLFYYADEKYNISEKIPDEKEIKRIIDVVMPHIVEDNVREFFAKKYGLNESVVEAKDYDIDACLLRFKNPEIAIEIKWKKNITQQDITKAETNLGKVSAKKKILFVQDKKGLKSNLLHIMDVSDLLTISKN